MFSLYRFSARARVWAEGAWVAAILAGWVVAGRAAETVGGAAAEMTFEREVRPILKAYCFTCHGEGEKLKGGLDVRLRRFLVKGGESGAAIVPGHPEQSLLIAQVAKGEMPKGEKKLSAAQVETLRRWVAAGARTARPEPESLGKGPYFTEEERDFWAFQPLRRPAVPVVVATTSANDAVRTPVDAFLLAKLRARGLGFSPAADRVTLIRRATFDLTGLPPTPEEVDAFVADAAPGAFERVVERLLQSPHYGERWGRHWLDVAGYADSEGYDDRDTERKHAYRYRDYVIRSLNADKPLDQFIREQLAGDELVKPPLKNLSADAVELVTATGFLRMAPDGTTFATDQKAARNAVVADTIKIVSTSLLGLSVGCAQCHDHRHDPISQLDYYRFRAIFEPALDWKNWKTPNGRAVSLLSDADRKRMLAIEAEAKALEVARVKEQSAAVAAVFERELAKVPEDKREVVRAAWKTVVAKRSGPQKKLLKDFPSVDVTAANLGNYDKAAAAKFEEMTTQAAWLRATKPVEEFVAALTEPVAATNPPTFLFHRGDPDSPRERATPGEPAILAASRAIDFPEKSAALPTSGRRLALARSLTDGTHPLTTRVLVNRVWLHHFGRGLVGTPGDFGQLGERPTHPELLDWLATELVVRGWSLKQLHRVMMNSTAYRQGARRSAAAEAADPDNHLLGRMNVRRLEAEIIRDAALAVSGKLTRKLFGAPVPITEDDVGQVVVGVDTRDGAGRPTGKFVPLNEEEFRRSLYVTVRRSKPLGMLQTFDLPAMEPNCEAREISTVAPQSLALMNGEFAVEQARYLAERVVREAGADVRAQAARAWRLAYGAAPGAAELDGAVGFIRTQTAWYQAHPVTPGKAAKGKPEPLTDAALLALANYCHALLSSNRFIYVN